MYRIEEDREALAAIERVIGKVLHTLSPEEEPYADTFVQHYLEMSNVSPEGIQAQEDVPLGFPVTADLWGYIVVQLAFAVTANLIAAAAIKRFSDLKASRLNRKEISAMLSNQGDEFITATKIKGFNKRQHSKILEEVIAHLLEEVPDESED